MTPRVQQALRDGFMECRHRRGVDEDFDAYFEHCQRLRRPFVRLHRRGQHYYIEVDLITTSQVFTEERQRRGLEILLTGVTEPRRAKVTFSSLMISCDYVRAERAHAVAAQVYAFASTAPLSTSVLSGIVEGDRCDAESPAR